MAGSIERAIAALGENAAGNYHLEPDQHVARLRDAVSRGERDGAPLLELLESQAVKDVYAAYVEADQAAGRHQKAYKLARTCILLSIFSAFAISLIAFTVPWPVDWEASLIPAATAVIYLGLIGATFFSWRTTRREDYKNWMEARGTAELLRRKLFDTVMAAPGKGAAQGADAPSLLQLKLEHFRRYQLDLQKAYYQFRGRDNERWAALTAVLHPILLAAFCLWTIAHVVGSVSGRIDQGALDLPAPLASVAHTVLGLMQRMVETTGFEFGVLVAAVGMACLYGFLLLRSIFNSNVRNAARFATARDNFEALTRELGVVRDKAAAGREEDVRAFIARVHGVMASEAGDWVRLGKLDIGHDTSGQKPATA